MDEYYLIAGIVSAYGKKGHLRLESFSDFPDRFFDLEKVYIDFFGDMKSFTIEDVEDRGHYFTVKFERFDSPDDCEVLIGRKIYVDEASVVELPEETWFIHDLVGCMVMKNGQAIGTITDVYQMPANDVLVITDKQGKELLVPVLRDLIEEVDIGRKQVTLKPGDELYDADYED